MRRFRVYHQLERTDCGLTCVRMIARHFGKKVTVQSLRALCEMNRLGMSIADILDCFKAIGMRGEVVRIGIEDFYRMPLPAILFWNQNHFVVAYESDARRKSIKIADPAEGRRTLTEEELMGSWGQAGGKGIAIMAGPEDDFSKLRLGKESSVKGLLRLVRKALFTNRRSFIALIVLSILIMAADIVVPLMFQRTVDEGIIGKDMHLVWLLILGQLAIFIGNFISSSAVDLIVTKLGLKMSLTMVREYLGRLIRQPLSFFDSKVNSDLIQKVDDQSRLKDFILTLPQTLFLMATSVAVFSGMLFWYSPLIFCFFIVLSLLELGWTILFLARQRRLDYSHFRKMSESRNNIYELVNGMPEIKSNNAQEQKVDEWHHTQEQINRLSMKSALLNLTSDGGQGLIGHIKDLGVTGVCAALVIDGGMSFGIMMTVGYIAGRLSGPFRSLVSVSRQMQSAQISYERLEDVLEDKGDESGTVCPTTSSISFRDVSFKYPGGSSPMVLKNINLDIEPGKTTAIVGESGSGKTTLLKLMLGFYAPTEGTLLLGGADSTVIDTDAWLGKCGSVMQSGYIFSGSIMENIALSAKEANPHKVKQAAAIAGLDEFITRLPMGYHTRIGSTGLELSGGQKQRLLMARAVYKDPDIVFMDEATSSLDANTERKIVENLGKFNSGKTVIISAHRLSTVRNADYIISLENGEIVERGSHEELIHLRGKYYSLVKNQLEIAK